MKQEKKAPLIRLAKREGLESWKIWCWALWSWGW